MVTLKKRNLPLAFIFVMILFLLACGNRAYEDAMDNGKQALIERDYETALIHFQSALEEKKDDKDADRYILQTETFINAFAYFEEGSLTEAKEHFEQVIQIENTSDELTEKAKQMITEIEALNKSYKDISQSIKKIEEHHEEGNFKKALEEIEETLAQDFSHEFIKPLKKKLGSLKKDIKKNKKRNTNVKKTIEEATSHKKNKQYDQALAAVEKGLEKKLKHSSLKQHKNTLEKLKEEIILLQQKEQKKINLISSIDGFWADNTVKKDTLVGLDICKINSEAVTCVTLNSDNAFYLPVNKRTANLDNNSVDINDGEFTIKVSSNNIVLFENNYTALTEENKQLIFKEYSYDEDSADEYFNALFNPEFIEAMLGINGM